MKKDEALKLALEALIGARAFLESDAPVEIWSLNDKAITAIKEALAQPEQELTTTLEASVHAGFDKKNDKNPQVDHQGKQPEQEPVAWRNAALRVGEDLCSVGPFGYYDMTAEEWLDWALSVVTVHAPPPQRTWVGLTDEEISELIRATHNTGSFVRAIEAKLKEKNT